MEKRSEVIFINGEKTITEKGPITHAYVLCKSKIPITKVDGGQ